MPRWRSFVNVFGLIIFVCTVSSRSTEAQSSPRTNEIYIEAISEPHDLSEGPHWDIDDQVLYFVDIPNQRLYCYNPATGNITNAYIRNGQLGVVIPVAGQRNTFIGGAGTEVVQITWDPTANNSDPAIKVLATVDRDRNGTRFNDGKIDPSGRFWAGTMGINLEPDLGTLYRFDHNFVPRAMIRPVSISNGLAWSADNATLYYNDSPTLQVVAYDYDDATGDIANKRVVFDLSTHNISGVPDGMTIDNAGNLWVACNGGGRVISIDPITGRLLRTVEVPAQQVASVAFGGPNLDVLYVTSGREGLQSEDLQSQPAAGSVFAVRGLNVNGTPMRDYRM